MRGDKPEEIDGARVVSMEKVSRGVRVGASIQAITVPEFLVSFGTVWSMIGRHIQFPVKLISIRSSRN